MLSDHNDDLALTFTFAVRFPETAEDSDAEREAGEGMRANYIAAIAATLKVVRDLVDRSHIG